jgi:hypothetical protein
MTNIQTYDWTSLSWVQSYARDWANVRGRDMVVFRERNSNIYHICGFNDLRWRASNIIYAQHIKSEPCSITIN